MSSTTPAWSSDGTFIALVRYRLLSVSKLVGIYLIRADGSGEAFTLSTGGESWPAWQPQR
jgi:hypothetical protein